MVCLWGGASFDAVVVGGHLKKQTTCFACCFFFEMNTVSGGVDL